MGFRPTGNHGNVVSALRQQGSFLPPSACLVHIHHIQTVDITSLSSVRVCVLCNRQGDQRNKRSLQLGAMLQRLMSLTRANNITPHDTEDNRPIPPQLQRPKHIPSQAQLAKKAKQRISFQRHGAFATGWPSQGGVLLKSVDAVDLQYLGRSRCIPTPSSDPPDSQEEDSWCDSLRRLSPHWAPSRQDWDYAAFGGRPHTQLETQSVYVGWPSSGDGVWVLKCTTGREPHDFGVYDMCLSMDERCSILRDFGARFFEDPSECFELSKAYSDEHKQQREDLLHSPDDFDCTEACTC